eukprot:snap_masked-scaffold_145-processed-gene-0.2-mRNA-1 protein AED:0.30 eAED:0.30 QI:0/-1/0/1/-1/1/1/0/232
MTTEKQKRSLENTGENDSSQIRRNSKSRTKKQKLTEKELKLAKFKEGKLGEEEESHASEVFEEALSEDGKEVENFKIASKEGIIKISNIPHGFYEKEMEGYFSQFGEVTNVRCSRARKSFKPRGYGYVQFKNPDVAEVAQKSMHNYVLFEKVVRCSLMDPEKVHDDIFHPSLMRRFPINYARKGWIKKNQPKSLEEKTKIFNQVLSKEKEKKQKLKKLGIEYNFVAHKVVKS